MHKEKETVELRRCQQCHGMASVDHVCSQVAEDAERAEVARKNFIALGELMRDHQLLIPARSIHLWRPTERALGAIHGLHEGLTIVATDGLLGWFLTHDGTAWLGHIGHFDGDIKPLYSFHGPMTAKPSKIKTKKKTKRQMIIDSL